MKAFKNLLVLFILFFASSFAFCQSPLAVGQAQLNAGLGLSEWGIPFYVGLDVGVHKDISVGAEFSYRSYHEKWKDYRYNHSIMGFSGNGNYHFNTVLNIPQKWDFYAGLNIGFYVWDSPNKYVGTHTSSLGLGAQVGGRYYFNDKVGINLEGGSGNVFSSGKIGVSVKL